MYCVSLLRHQRRCCIPPESSELVCTLQLWSRAHPIHIRRYCGPWLIIMMMNCSLPSPKVHSVPLFFFSWECYTCRSCPEFQPEIGAPSLMMPSHLVISSPVVWHSRSRCLSLSRGMIGKSALPLQTPIATEPVSCGTAAAFRIRYFPWTCWWPEFVVVVLVLLFPFGISKWSSLVAWLLLLQLGHSSAHHLLGWKWYGYFQSYSNSIWFGKFFICLYPILNFEYSISLTNAYLDSKSYVFMVATSIIILFGKN